MRYRTHSCPALNVQAAQAAAAATKQGAKQGRLVQPDDDSLDPNQFYERRTKAVKNARDAHIEPYPHKFPASIQVPEFISQYKDLPDGQHSEDKTESVAGQQRESASKLSVPLRWASTASCAAQSLDIMLTSLSQQFIYFVR